MRRPYAGVVETPPMAVEVAEKAVRVADYATLAIQRYVSG